MNGKTEIKKRGNQLMQGKVWLKQQFVYTICSQNRPMQLNGFKWLVDSLQNVIKIWRVHCGLSMNCDLHLALS